jgi:hypothetical protein
VPIRNWSALLLTAALTAAPPGFEPVQPELFSTGGTLANAFADYDGDRDLDLFVGFNGAPNRLYRNDAGVFVDAAAAAGVNDGRATRGAAWGDYDRDGDPDLLVGFAPGPQSLLKLYRNDRGRFVDVTREAGVARDSGAVRQMAWVDFDGDADLDLFVAFRDRPNALYRNEGGRFSDVAASIGLADPRKTVGAVWFDYDEDGDLDVYVGNMDGDANGLWQNDNGRFTDVAAARGLQWGGRTPSDPMNGTVRPCTADVNNDGHIDLFTANYGKNGLFLNRGGGRFDDVSAEWGIAVDSRYDSCAFADIDNDGILDLYVNGTVTGGTNHRDYLYRNEGSRFVDVTPTNIEALQSDHGVQWADFDLDGDQDLALTGAGMHLIMRNMSQPAEAGRSIHIAVADSLGRPLTAGTEVRLFVARTRSLIGTRIVDAGSGYNSQNAMPMHFGRRVGADVEVFVPGRASRTPVRISDINTNVSPRCTIVITILGDTRGRADPRCP